MWPACFEHKGRFDGNCLEVMTLVHHLAIFETNIIWVTFVPPINLC